MKYTIVSLFFFLVIFGKMHCQTLAYPNKIIKGEGYTITSSSGEVKLIASELIQLKPGVQIRTGSKFFAQIKENYAVYPTTYGTVKFPAYTQLISDELIIKRVLNQAVSIHTILIYDSQNKYQRQIKTDKTQEIVTVSFLGQVPGLYHLILIYSDGTNKELKVFKN